MIHALFPIVIAVRSWSRRSGIAFCVVAVLLMGCRSSSFNDSPLSIRQEVQPASNTLDAAYVRASGSHLPLVLLVAEPGATRADDNAWAMLRNSELRKTLRKTTNQVVASRLDMSISRNRAQLTRFHVIRTPLLLCLSPQGILVSRDVPPITEKLISTRIEELVRRAPELDAKFASLEQAVARDTNNAAARSALADFLLGQQNALEAIAHLEVIAHSERNPVNQRTRAWIELARAHLWVGEPEKARQEAQSLDAALGARDSQARAGSKLILGIHDANLKRPDQARQEFQSAIDLAPGSPYAREAAQLLEELRKGGDPR